MAGVPGSIPGWAHFFFFRHCFLFESVAVTDRGRWESDLRAISDSGL